MMRFCDTIMKDVPEIRLIHLKEDINTNIYYNPNKMQELLSMDNKQISDFIDGSILKEIIAIVDYANDCFKLISGAYQCVVIKYDYKLNRIIQKSSKQNTEENKNNIIYTTRNGRQHYMTNNRYEQETDVETDKYDPTLPNYYDWLMKK
jgi:restriction endonuclease S subunit